MKVYLHVLSALIAVAVLINPIPSAARTWSILPDGSGDAPTIQAGIDSALAGDVVEVACGTYYEHDIDMKSGVTLRSTTESPECVTIDAQQQGRVLVCDEVDADASITGFTVTGGHMPGNDDLGGGMICTDSYLTISHCDFIANYAGWEGGGIGCYHGAPVITYCQFVDNEGYMGGGGVMCHFSDADILHCLFESNVATDGAGLFCQRSSPRVEWCTFLNNDGMFFGGGIFCHINASPTFDHCSIVGNKAYLGGGIMTVAESYPTIDNSIIAFSRVGSGMHWYDEFGDSTYAYISCSDVYGNEGGGYTGWIDDQTGINGNIAADPLFCDLDTGDITIAAESPCLPGSNDCAVLMGALDEGCSVTPVPESVPDDLPLLAIHPNPFNPHTTITFSLRRSQHVTILVYDLTGRRVAVLTDQMFGAGMHRAEWNGLDASDQAVSSGTYIVMMEAEGYVESQKIMVLR